MGVGEVLDEGFHHVAGGAGIEFFGFFDHDVGGASDAS